MTEENEAETSPTPPPARRRRFRWWWVVCGLLLLFLVFHQALLRAVIKTFVISAARSVQLDANFNLSGSVWTNLAITNLVIRPAGDTPVERLDAARIFIGYDLSALRRPNLTGLLTRLEIQDMVVDVDETKLPPLPEDQPIRFPFLLPNTVIVDRLDVNYIRGNGSVIAFDNFHIRLVPGEAGYIAFEKLSIPGLAPLYNYQAPLSFENRVLTLKEVVTTEIGELDDFSFDGSQTEMANFGISLAGALLGGDLRLQAKLSDANRHNIMWLRLTGYNLKLADLKKAFPAFEPLSGSVKTIHLTFDGPLEYPRQWILRLDLEGNDLRWGDLPRIGSELVLTADSGVLKIESGYVETRRERLNVGGAIQLPENVSEFHLVTGELTWEGKIGALERFTGGKIRGSTATDGKLSFGNDKLDTHWSFTGEQLRTAEMFIASASIQGEATIPLRAMDHPDLWKLIEANAALNFKEITGQNYTVDSISGNVRLASGHVAVEKAEANIAGNLLTLDVSADPADLTELANLDLWSGTIAINAPNLIGAAAAYAPFPISGQLSANGEITKSGAQFAGSIDLAGSNVTFQNLYAQTVKGEIVARGRELAVSALDLFLLNRSILSASGKVSMDGKFPWSAVLSVVAEDASVLDPWLAQAIGRPLTTDGGLFGGFAASGDASGAAPSWNGAAFANDIRFGESPGFSIALPVFGSKDNAIDLPSISIKLPGNGELAGSARISNEGKQPFEAHLKLNVPDLEGLEPILKELGMAKELGGAANATLDAKGTLADRSYEGNLKASVQRGRFGELTNIDLQVEAAATPGTISVPVLRFTSNQLDMRAAVTARDGSLFVDDLRIGQGGTNFVEGHARIPFTLASEGEMFPLGEPVTVTLRAPNVEISRLLRPFMPDAGMQGRIDLTVDVSGPLGNPTGTAKLIGTNLQSAKVTGFAPATLDLQLNLASKRLELAGTVTQRQLQEIKISGNVPLDMEKILNKASVDLSSPVALDLSMPPVALTFLKQMVPGIRTIDGTFGVDVRLRGTMGEPQLSGSGLFALNTLRMDNEAIPPIYAGRAQLEFTGQKLTISGFQVEVAGGPLAVGGSIDFPTLTSPALDLWIKGTDVLILRNDAMIIRANLDLAVDGPLVKADVKGGVGLTKSRFFRDIEIVPLNIPGRPAPPLPGGPPVISVTAPPFRDWTFDTLITTVDPFDVRGNLANGSILVDLRLTGTGLEPKLVGDIRIERLLASLPFSRLTVQRGYLYFNETRQPADPIIDLHGTSTIRDTLIDVYVYGTAQQPSVLFVSQPPMSQEEIMTLLATGVTQEEIARGGAGVVAGRAAWLYLQRLYRRVFGQAAIEDQSDDFINRIDFDIGGVDPETGQQSFQGRFRITDQFQLVGDISLGANVRLVLRYLLRFR